MINKNLFNLIQLNSAKVDQLNSNLSLLKETSQPMNALERAEFDMIETLAGDIPHSTFRVAYPNFYSTTTAISPELSEVYPIFKKIFK